MTSTPTAGGTVTAAPPRPRLFVLSTPDPQGMVGYYRELLGWSLQPVSAFPTAAPAAGSAQSLVVREGQGGWLPFLAVPDLGAALERVRAAGGRVVHPLPDDASGRAASVFDPSGTRLGVTDVDPAPAPDPDPLAPGRVVWIEQKTGDQDAATGFAGAVFGFGVAGPTGPGKVRTLLPPGAAPYAGVMAFDDRYPPDQPPFWLLYAAGPVDATIARAEALGGSVWIPPTDTPLGVITYLRDPAGNPLAVVDVADTARGLLLGGGS